jgi:hypothetical protein
LSWDTKTEAGVISTFAVFAQLFGTKCQQQGLVVYSNEERGIHSPTFLLWCQKLSGLRLGEFKSGWAVLEKRVENAGREGKDLWPPTYAEFLGMCTRNHETRAHVPFKPESALEDLGAKEAAKEAGAQAIADMRATMGLPPKEEG